MGAGHDAKIERVELRASTRQTAVIKQAAEATGKTVTAFVLDAAFVEAQRALADRRLFRLDAGSWARFVKALDRPIKPKARLRKLIEQPSILDQRDGPSPGRAALARPRPRRLRQRQAGA